MLSAVFGTALVYAAALVTARSKIHPHGNLVIESMAQITNTIPGMVLGIAFLLAFRRTPLHNTIVIIIACNLVHFFATPSVSDYEALHGDYEFRIVGKSDDNSVIYLKGRRTNNNYNLVKFSGDPVDYLNKVNAVQTGMSAPASIH